LVEHNYFYKTDGEIEIISGKSSNSIYRYNIFRNCRGGLTLRHGTNCLVEGNLFFGESRSGSYGVRIIDRDHLVINNYFSDLNSGGSGVRHPITLMTADLDPVLSGVQHVIRDTIAYNTIVNCEEGILVGADDKPVPPEDVLFLNNVVQITNDPPVIHDNSPINISYQGNFFHRTDGGVSVPTTGFVDIDPLLSLAPGDSILRPVASSPIIGAAVSGLVKEIYDFEFQPRLNTNTSGADAISSSNAIDRGIFGPTWLAEDPPLPVSVSDLESTYEKIKLLNQGDNRKFGLYFPPNELGNNDTASFFISSINGIVILKEQTIHPEETIYLGENWPPNQYLIYCKYPSGKQDVLKWIKW